MMEDRKQATSSWRVILPMTIAIVGVALSVLAYVQAKRSDSERVRNAFELRADFRAEEFHASLEDATVPVEALADFLAVEDDLTPDEFRNFVTRARGNDPIARLAWAPLVRDADRARFEAEARRQSDGSAFAISDANTDQKLVPATQRDEYLPALYEHRFDGLESLRGLDWLGRSDLDNIAARARDSGEPMGAVLTRPLVGSAFGPRLFVVWPVYVGPVSAQTFGGVAVGAFPVVAVVDFAMQRNVKSLATVSVFVGHHADEPFGVPLAVWRPGIGKAQAGEENLGPAETASIRLVQSFDAFGQSWTMVLDYSPGVVAPLRSAAPLRYLALGLLLTVILAAIAMREQRRRWSIEATVAERTSDLHKTTEQMRALIESSPIPIGSLDLERVVLSWNASAQEIFGYTTEEAVGRPYPALPLDADASWQELLRRLLGGEVLRGFEIVQRTKDGRLIDTLASAALYRNPSGTPIGIVFAIQDVTESKRKEAIERQLTSRLRGVIDTAPDGIILIDHYGAILTFNPACESLFGYAADEVIGKNIKLLMPPSYAEAHDGYLDRYHSTGERRIIGIGRDVTGKRKDGTEFPMHLAVGEIKQDGDPIYAGIIRDLTEHRNHEESIRQSEAKIRRSEEHLARVQRVARISSAELNLLTREGYWSDEIYHMFGIAPGSAAPEPEAFFDKIHPEDRVKLREAMALGLRRERVEPFEFRVPTASGGIRWYYRQSDFVRDDNGNATRYIATYVDITDRKAAEEAQRASEEQYRLTFDQAPIGIAHVDRDGKIILINESYCRFLGRSSATLVGVRFNDLTHPDDRALTRTAADRVRKGETPTASIEKRYVRPDESIAWCRLTMTAQRSATGDLQHLIIIADDISAAKAADERRAELEEQLQQSQKMDAVGQLTGGVAHDFNNLLTVVLGNLELVRESVEGNAKLVRQIDAAIGAGQRGADLTHRLLAFSRRQPLEPVVVDINRCIDELVPLLARAIGEAIEIKQTLGSALWRVVIDPSQLENSIMNLAVNARDAMPRGGTLEITSENVAVDEAYASQRPGLIPGHYVRISVSDTGSGIPPEIVSKVFEPFFTTKDVGRGTGLGLSMVYGFVKQSGGHASIYSEVGVGTTVTMLLPADPGDRDLVVARVAAAVAKTGTEAVLVVEDDAAVRKIAIAFLDALGYRTFEASTGVEGFDVFATHPEIDLILSDVILPGGEDGASFVRRARALRPAIKVLFMSGYTEDVIMHEGRLDAGVVLLRKPFTRAQVAEKVRAVIDGAPPKPAQ